MNARGRPESCVSSCPLDYRAVRLADLSGEEVSSSCYDLCALQVRAYTNAPLRLHHHARKRGRLYGALSFSASTIHQPEHRRRSLGQVC